MSEEIPENKKPLSAFLSCQSHGQGSVNNIVTWKMENVNKN